MATVFSGAPSTLYFFVTSADLWLPIQAVGTTMLPADSSAWSILLAAGVIHCAVSMFWAVIVAGAAPAKHVVAFAMSASALIAVLDLRIIAPALFPDVANLSFWPQFADHLAWGMLLGMTLHFRQMRRRAAIAA